MTVPLVRITHYYLDGIAYSPGRNSLSAQADYQSAQADYYLIRPGGIVAIPPGRNSYSAQAEYDVICPGRKCSLPGRNS